MASRTSLFNWIREHRLASMITIAVLLVLLSGIWWIRPAVFAATHTNMQNCGAVFGAFNGPVSPAPGTRESETQFVQCFVQAHRKCQAASLEYTAHGVDTGTTETFYTANGLGQCGLSLETMDYGLVRTTTTDANCASMVQKPDGLHFLSCGDSADVLFPVK